MDTFLLFLGLCFLPYWVLFLFSFLYFCISFLFFYTIGDDLSSLPCHSFLFILFPLNKNSSLQTSYFSDVDWVTSWLPMLPEASLSSHTVEVPGDSSLHLSIPGEGGKFSGVCVQSLMEALFLLCLRLFRACNEAAQVIPQIWGGRWNRAFLPGFRVKPCSYLSVRVSSLKGERL